MKILKIDPMKKPEVIEIENTLEAKQKVVGGQIEAVYPWEDMVALICNDEGKLNNMPFNRVLRDPEGHIYDAVHGTFFIAGITDTDFCDISEEQIQKFGKLFAEPEMLVDIPGGKMVVRASVWEDRNKSTNKKEKGDIEL